MSLVNAIVGVIVLSAVDLALTTGPKVAPYVDITMPIDLERVALSTGQKDYTIAFAIASAEGCEPKWGGTVDLNDTSIIKSVRKIQKQGGQVIVATGGALGPYLENLCDRAGLVQAYEKILDVTQTNHLDIDIEATVDLNKIGAALAELKKKRPQTTVSYTLMAQGDDYGLNDALGVNSIRSANDQGLIIDIINIMAMEYGSNLESWGDAVIAVAEATLKQLKKVYPTRTQTELKQLLGVTPMIGRNFNSKIFLPEHAKQLVSWAEANRIGRLAFWSVGRDNGNCAGAGVSPICSSVAQSSLEFTKIFSKYNPSEATPTATPTPQSSTTNSTIASTVISSTASNLTSATTEAIPRNSTTDSGKVTHPPPADPPQTTTTEPTSPNNKVCQSHSVTPSQKPAFDAWCVANCAMNFCPPEFCRCT